jgi:hypothetical protein
LALWSEDFTQSVWSQLNSSVTANATTSPDGTQNADKIVESSATGLHGPSQSITVTTGNPYTFSVYLKASERTWALVWFDSEIAGAYVNLSTGALGTISSGVTASVTDAGNGWYRCVITKTIGTGGAIRVFTALGNNDVSYTGNGTSGLFVWGAQLE